MAQKKLVTLLQNIMLSHPTKYSIISNFLNTSNLAQTTAKRYQGIGYQYKNEITSVDGS